MIRKLRSGLESLRFLARQAKEGKSAGVERPQSLFPGIAEKPFVALLQAGKAGRLEAPSEKLEDLEYGLFSQFGEDGIIEQLAARVPEESRWFVEFGVEDYVESNTRLLLLRDYWKGLVLDGSASHIDSIRSRPDFWRVTLRAETAFVTRENIAALVAAHGFGGRPGLLSIDIDGNDYWVWEALADLRPWIVVCEYNALFGAVADVSIPYRSDFRRHLAHQSGLYFGASLSALVRLGAEMGFRFLGVNRAGNNAFFADPGLDVGLPGVSVEEAYRKAVFRESRNREGDLDYREGKPDDPSFDALPLHDFARGSLVTCGEVLGRAPGSPGRDGTGGEVS